MGKFLLSQNCFKKGKVMRLCKVSGAFKEYFCGAGDFMYVRKDFDCGFVLFAQRV
jgi:hypothetical protein